MPGRAARAQRPRARNRRGLTTEPGRAVVTGASTGIGRAVAAALAEAGWRVLGCGRRAGTAGADLGYEQVDLTAADGPQRLANRAARTLGAVDLVVLNAGGYGPSGRGYEPSRPQQNVGSLTAPAALEVLAVNAVAPLMTAQALIPLLSPGPPLPVVMLVSSRVGSLSLRRSAGDLYYAPSKAAANMVLRALSMLAPRPATFVAVDPGWVRTAAGGTAAPVGAHAAGAALVALLGRIDDRHNGSFIGLDDAPIPW